MAAQGASAHPTGQLSIAAVDLRFFSLTIG
jgi:hypothetical protein